MIFLLDDKECVFPDPALAEEDGLLAIGGDLSIERLLQAYQQGIFPWYAEDEPICWYAPHERCVIYPDEIVVSKSMKKVLGQNTFNITMNRAFEAVIEHCRTIYREGQGGTWITNEMKAAYLELHKLGIAHSVEVWQDDQLVGGLYGLAIHTVFCGESMFSKVSNASKAALIWLCQHTNYALIDCQLPTDHLISMGAKMISREKYLGILHGNKQ